MNGMRDVFSLPYLHNKDKTWDILLHQSNLPLEYMKCHVQSLQKRSEEYQYVVQNLMWSGVYLRSNFSNTLLHKVLTLVLMTSTRPEIFFATMTTLIYDYYNDLEESLTQMKSINIKSYPRENVTDCCEAILVDAERLESAGAFTPE